MTKRELLARLAREPIVVRQVAKLSHCCVALHDDPRASNGVWLGLASVAGALLPDDAADVYARLNGKIVRLTDREAAAILARVRTFLAFSTRSA